MAGGFHVKVKQQVNVALLQDVTRKGVAGRLQGSKLVVVCYLKTAFRLMRDS